MMFDERFGHPDTNPFHIPNSGPNAKNEEEQCDAFCPRCGARCTKKKNHPNSHWCPNASVGRHL